jgi:hypothetical protein
MFHRQILARVAGSEAPRIDYLRARRIDQPNRFAAPKSHGDSRTALDLLHRRSPSQA